MITILTSAEEPLKPPCPFCILVRSLRRFYMSISQGNKIAVPKVFFIKCIQAEARAVSRFVG